MLLCKLIFMTVLVQVLTAREQKFVMEPQDQVAVVGSRVVLNCRIINQAGLLQWTHDGFAMGKFAGFQRYSFIGNEQEGDYTMMINPVKLEDDGIYQCQIGAGQNGEKPKISRHANLSVLVPPKPPKIIQGHQLSITEGTHVELECVSAAGRPAAKITWVDGEGNVLQDVIDNIIQTNDDNKTYDTRSILKMTARAELNNITLICQAQNSADRSYRTARLQLHVQFAPKLKLVADENSSKPVEGQTVRLLCLASANPPDVTYRWSINDQLLLGNSTSNLEIKNISQKHHNSVVKCEVYNTIGTNEKTLTLDVSYGPRFKSKPYSVQADLGASVTLTCDVDGNPLPSVVWMHEDTSRVVSTSPNLTLSVSNNTAGRYSCRATVPGFPDIKAEATIYVKGPPTVISHRIQYGTPGENVRLECSAFSIPTPQKVVWSFQGENVRSDLDYYVVEEQLTEGIKSTLIIQDSRLEHFGVYNCTVSNPYGSDEVEITLRAQKTFPVHTTLIGIMSGIVILVTASALYMMCQRTPKSQTDASRAAKPRESDKASNTSDIKLEFEYTGDDAESDSGSENTLHGTGLPLAGPIPLDYRYSLIGSMVTPLQNEGRNNNGYVAIPDYIRDYEHQTASVSPVPQPASGTVNNDYVPITDYSRVYERQSANVCAVPKPASDTIDPRYSAAYGNPYLRLAPTSIPETGLPPPPYNTTNHPSQQDTINTLVTHI